MIRPTTAPLTITVAAAGALLLLGRSSIVAAQVVVQPFYLEQTDSSINPDTGVFAPYKTKTIARRADGITVVVDGLGSSFAGKVRKVMSPDGLAVTLWENEKLKTTWPPMTSRSIRAR